MLAETRVKICGITNPEDAELAAKAGADAIGMVFYAKSSRHLGDFGKAREIAQAAGPFTQVVALTVNAESAFIDELNRQVQINMIQFHGDEDEGFCSQFRRPYLKALRMKPEIDLAAEIDRFMTASGILLDTYVKGIPGGTGEAFSWGRVPSDNKKPIILAGGLTPTNVREAIRVAKPYAVDVSGGVELAPGKKDKLKVAAFIQNAKSE